MSDSILKGRGGEEGRRGGEEGRGGGGNPLSPNSSETAWNFQTPFYKKEAGSIRMV